MSLVYTKGFYKFPQRPLAGFGLPGSLYSPSGLFEVPIVNLARTYWLAKSIDVSINLAWNLPGVDVGSCRAMTTYDASGVGGIMTLPPAQRTALNPTGSEAYPYYSLPLKITDLEMAGSFSYQGGPTVNVPSTAAPRAWHLDVQWLDGVASDFASGAGVVFDYVARKAYTSFSLYTTFGGFYIPYDGGGDIYDIGQLQTFPSIPDPTVTPYWKPASDVSLDFLIDGYQPTSDINNNPLQLYWSFLNERTVDLSGNITINVNNFWAP